VDPDCRLLDDPVAALAQLRERFPAEQLLASGVARQAEADLVMSPLLSAEDRGFVVLRTLNGAAFDIMTAAGCVSGAPPVLKVLHDRIFKQGAIRSPHRLLYATLSMVDTVLLRSLGVAAASAAQLQSLSLGQLQRLLVLVGGSARGDIPKQDVQLPTDEPEDRRTNHMGSPDDEPAEFQLALLAGSVSAMTAEVPPGLAAVARHLANAERHIGFSWDGIRVWHPTPQILANLRYRRRLRSLAALRQFFARHPAQYPLQAFERAGPPVMPTPTPAETYFKLLEQQQSRRTDPYNFKDILHDPQTARQPYDTFVDQHFVRPLIDRAMESPDPEDRALYMEMAGLARLHHRIMPAIFDLQCRSAKEVRENEGQILPKEAFRQLDYLDGRLQKLIIQHKASQRERRGRRRG
jgi:hypothetical protein